MFSIVNEGRLGMLTTHDRDVLPEATGMRPVRALRLAVVARDGRWEIVVNGRAVGGFALEADAQRCLLDIAGQTRCDGYPVEVLEAPVDAKSFNPVARRSAE